MKLKCIGCKKKTLTSTNRMNKKMRDYYKKTGKYLCLACRQKKGLRGNNSGQSIEDVIEYLEGYENG